MGLFRGLEIENYLKSDGQTWQHSIVYHMSLLWFQKLKRFLHERKGVLFLQTGTFDVKCSGNHEKDSVIQVAFYPSMKW